MTEKEQVLYDLFSFKIGDINYLINISNKYKYIYFEVPKTGCSTIKRTLQKLEVDDTSKIQEDVHNKDRSPLLSPLQLEEKFTEYLNGEYFKFAFVRNPYTRALSCYLEKIVNKKIQFLSQLGFSSEERVSFKKYLLAIQKQSPTKMNVHWRPQSILLAADKIQLDFIGRQEDFDNDLKKILAIITKQDSGSLTILNEIPHAVGANKKLQEYLNEDTAKLIQEIYHDDFRLYGYDLDPFPSYGIKLNPSALVSIVIPCYNQAQYLEECVQSVVAQTYPNIEIIIVNDGSPDNTSETASALQKKYPHIIRVLTQENQGLSEARNNGIKVAKGNYILPLDADDKFDSNMISYCMHQMLKNNADIVYVDIQCFGASDIFAKKKPFSENHLLYENLPSVSSLYSKKIWEITGGYKQNMTEGYEDWEFWINAYKHNFTFFYLPETLLYYRVKDISRDTIAAEKDAYLQAKIVMNHPELYLNVRVEEAMNIIKEAEELSDLYFYYDKNIPENENKWMEEISHYLQNNTLKENQILTIFEKKVGLCNLDFIDTTQPLKDVYINMDVDFLLFYAPLRYELPLLLNSDFSWSKNEGIVKTKGNLFPYVAKAKRENIQLQHIAAERLAQYQEKVSNAIKVRNKKKNIKQIHDDLVSVVIPCYNQGQYLQETVESVISQTYTNIEIIIVNDGSTDTSIHVAEQLSLSNAHKNIKIINQENKGLSEARNQGILRAVGDYLFLLDADDVLEKESIYKCMNALFEHNVDVVYGDYQRFGESATVQKTKNRVELYDIQHANVTGATALFKKKIWEKTGGYKINMHGGYEDWELWVNAIKNGFKFHHLAEILFYYRVKKESMYVDAVKKHTYLCSKVIMNNRELYTEEQQDSAVHSIKTFEDSPSFYFYFDKGIFSKDKEIILSIGQYIQDNDLYTEMELKNSCTIPSLSDSKPIILSHLSAMHDKKYIEKSNNNDHIFYTKLKYDTKHVNIGNIEICSFAWDKERGCIPADGTLFPLFLYQNAILKIRAHKRLQRYSQDKYNILEKTLQKKNNYIKKLETKIENDKKNLNLNKESNPNTSLTKVALEQRRGRLVTVITRTKDRLLFIPRVFETIVHQTYRPIEWVIVNDNGQSIDMLIETLKIQYKEQLEGIEVCLINKEESTGMEAASNTGLEHTHGHYIKLLDDDDTLDPTCIAKQVHYLQNEKLPTERGVVCYTKKTFEKIENDKIHFLQNDNWNLTPKYLTISHLLKSNQFTVHSFLYERNVHDDIGFYNESLPVRGDWEFNLRFMMKFDIGVIPEVLANYHFRTEQKGAHGNSLVIDHLRYDATIRNQFMRNDKEHPAISAVMANHVGIGGLDRKLNDIWALLKTSNFKGN